MQISSRMGSGSSQSMMQRSSFIYYELKILASCLETACYPCCVFIPPLQLQHLQLRVKFDLSFCHETVSRTSGLSSSFTSCGYMRGLMCSHWLDGHCLKPQESPEEGRLANARTPLPSGRTCLIKS